uniref:Putative secreted protein n=1 Tax=Panstrongylus lignarius TaxID=156445 RepID=A0A224XT24_9HEMI
MWIFHVVLILLPVDQCLLDSPIFSMLHLITKYKFLTLAITKQALSEFSWLQKWMNVEYHGFTETREIFSLNWINLLLI